MNAPRKNMNLAYSDFSFVLLFVFFEKRMQPRGGLWDQKYWFFIGFKRFFADDENVVFSLVLCAFFENWRESWGSRRDQKY